MPRLDSWVEVSMSIILILGIGCCSLLVGGPGLIGACGEGDPSGDREGSA